MENEIKQNQIEIDYLSLIRAIADSNIIKLLLLRKAIRKHEKREEEKWKKKSHKKTTL